MKKQKEINSIGIVGGGQLAQMMIPAAHRLGLSVTVLDPERRCSAAGSANEYVQGDFSDFGCLELLAQKSDVVTLEIEKVDAKALAGLESLGHLVRPAAQIVEIIQDKYTQKRFLRRVGIPTSSFYSAASATEIVTSLPVVLKARRDSYDGRGVSVIRDTAELVGIRTWPVLVEEMVDIDYELAIMAARNGEGNIICYPVVDILMDPEKHVMDMVVAPSLAPEDVQKQCRSMAKEIVEELNYIGVLAVEFFVDQVGRVSVNEISPRPHNSGHYTIEACCTSQFEQHLRAVSGRPLGRVDLRRPAVSFNVLGEKDSEGVPRYIGFNKWDDPSISLHNYQKSEVKPNRKMGHVTIVADTREEALEKIVDVRPKIRVEG
jgi:5-(carboxyamino)imidazole ribonucleotide synthase